MLSRLAAVEKELAKVQAERDSAKIAELIAVNKVPEEVQDLLPKTPDELAKFLASEKYIKLKEKLDRASVPQEPTSPEPKGTPALGEKASPKTTKSTFKTIDSASLADLGRIIIGNKK